MILTGCIRDEHDPRDRPYRPSAGASGASGDVDLRPYFPEIWDQIANDCVAHSIGGLVMATASIAGHTVPRPSPLYMYANSRQLAMGALNDNGTNCRSMLKGMSGKTVQDAQGLAGLGMVPETDWPEVAETINTPPPDDLLRKGETWTIGEYFRLPEGAGAPEAIDLALSEKLPVTACLVVDQAFADLGAGIYMGNDGSQVFGGHCVAIVGSVHGMNAFILRNSWGTGWGDGGYGLIDRNCVANHVYDVWGLR